MFLCVFLFFVCFWLFDFLMFFCPGAIVLRESENRAGCFVSRISKGFSCVLQGFHCFFFCLKHVFLFNTFLVVLVLQRACSSVF